MSSMPDRGAKRSAWGRRNFGLPAHINTLHSAPYENEVFRRGRAFSGADSSQSRLLMQRNYRQEEFTVYYPNCRPP